MVFGQGVIKPKKKFSGPSGTIKYSQKLSKEGVERGKNFHFAFF